MYGPTPRSVPLFKRKDKHKIEGELTFPSDTVTKHTVKLSLGIWGSDLLSNCSKCGSALMHLALTCRNKNPNKTIEAHNPFINNVSEDNPDGESHHSTLHKYLSPPFLILSGGCLWYTF